MDQESEKKFNEIIANGPDSITEPEAEFLRARRSYLSEEQRVIFKDALSLKEEASEESEPSKNEKKAKSK